MYLSLCLQDVKIIVKKQGHNLDLKGDDCLALMRSHLWYGHINMKSLLPCSLVFPDMLLLSRKKWELL